MCFIPLWLRSVHALHEPRVAFEVPGQKDGWVINLDGWMSPDWFLLDLAWLSDWFLWDLAWISIGFRMDCW